MLLKFFLKTHLKTSSRRDKLASRAYKATKTVSLVISDAEGHFSLKHCTFTSQNHTSAVVSAFKAAPGWGTWICFLSSANKVPTCMTAALHCKFFDLLLHFHCILLGACTSCLITYENPKLLINRGLPLTVPFSITSYCTGSS